MWYAEHKNASVNSEEWYRDNKNTGDFNMQDWLEAHVFEPSYFLFFLVFSPFFQFQFPAFLTWQTKKKRNKTSTSTNLTCALPRQPTCPCPWSNEALPG